jgi:hypothetical protein
VSAATEEVTQAVELPPVADSLATETQVETETTQQDNNQPNDMPPAAGEVQERKKPSARRGIKLKTDI